MKDMGLPLEMTPNYDDFSCQVRANIPCYILMALNVQCSLEAQSDGDFVACV